MLKIRLIETGQSPWSSPVVIEHKRDGSIRLSIDRLPTSQQSHVLMRIHYPVLVRLLGTLSKIRYFSTLDLISRCWQVSLTDQARLKTAPATREELYF